MSMYESEVKGGEPGTAPPTAPPAEPGAAPPAEAVPEYGASEGLASGSWWESMSLTIFGKQVTNEQAKMIIYVGAAALVIVTVALVVSLSGGDGGGGDGGGAVPAPGGSAAPAAPAFSSNRNSGVGIIVATTERGVKNDGTRVSVGAQCEFQPGSAVSDCSGAAGARCGITPNGEVYAWLMADVRDCTNPVCAPIEGLPVRYGCSRASSGASFIECCVAIETPTTVDCPAPISTETDWASLNCRSNALNTDTSAGRTQELVSGGSAFTVSCSTQCANLYAPGSCDHCSCVFGCQAAISGESFSQCMRYACSDPLNPAVDETTGSQCSSSSPGCAAEFAGDSCNYGCNIPYNADSVSPPALKFEFDGNLLDTSGYNHGRSHFEPAGSEQYVGGADSAEGRPGSTSQALVFDGDDYVTLQSPFPAEDTEFSLALWVAPKDIIFNGWHAIIGYQNGGVCPGRSPSMWVDGGGHGDNAAGVHKGLHYDTCEEETATRFAGVLENFFTTPDEFVHIAWVKSGMEFFFYRNGDRVMKPGGGSYAAPTRVQLSDEYNVGHNDNFFEGKIDEVAFFDYALTDTEVHALYTGQTTVAFSATGNVGAGSWPVQKAEYGQECQLFWNQGGCGGVDNGRCGVTASGEVYAWYLDAVAWCEDIDPFCGFVMGPPVRTGCSRATRADYFVECCVEENPGDDVQHCSDTVNAADDATSSCAQSLGGAQRTQGECDAQCTAQQFATGTEEGCACRTACADAIAGSNFEACAANCAARSGSTTDQCSLPPTGRAEWCADPSSPVCGDACAFGCSIPYRDIPQPAATVGMDASAVVTYATSGASGTSAAPIRVTRGTECSLSTYSASTCVAGVGQGPEDERCGITDTGEVYAWLLNADCTDATPECTFTVGPKVREGCSRAQRNGRWVECCHRLGGESADAVDCPNPVVYQSDPTATCSHSANPNVCSRVTDGTLKADGQPAGILEGNDEICIDSGEACEFFTHTHGHTCSDKCAEAGLVCQDGWDDNPDPASPGNCDHHLIHGTDESEQQLDDAGAHNYGVGGCDNPYGNQICKCRASNICQVDMEYPYDWHDISTNPGATAITDWTQNNDDGWKHIDIGFSFNWFGDIEHTVTVSTNGYLSFGTQGLRNGAVEPVPCHWDAANVGSLQTEGGCIGADGTATDYGSGHQGNGVDGVIAPFWADLTTAEATSNVFYQVVHPPIDKANMISWNKLYVQWDRVRVWNGSGEDITFQVILFGDGTVLMQYKDMPTAESGSWAQESIGFEDTTGTHGVQIAYGTVPRPLTAYHIPASCHVTHDNGACTPTHFELNPLELPWASAEDWCVRRGGHLASLHSAADQRAFEILTGHNDDYPNEDPWDADAVWIGFHDIHSEGGCNGDAFVWSDGTHADFTSWSAGEPNDWSVVDSVGASNCVTDHVHGGEDCVSGPPQRDWLWNDQDCSFTHKSVCGYCGDGYRGGNPTHFTYTEEPKTQLEAEDECIARGGHLASIHGRHDTDVLTQIVPDGVSAWIGFHDRDQEAGCNGNGFRWTDGTDASYTNWQDGEPNDWACPPVGEAPATWHDPPSERPDGCVSNCDAGTGGGLEDCASILPGPQGDRTDEGTWHPELGSNGVWSWNSPPYGPFTGWDGKWNDDMCDKRQPYVCGFATGSNRPSEFMYVPHVEGSPLHQRESEMACNRLGGHLASLHSDDDIQVALDLMHAEVGDSLATPGAPVQTVADRAIPGDEHTWIGMHDRASEEASCDGSKFLWNDDTVNDFSHWSAGEPNDWMCDTVTADDDARPCGFDEAGVECDSNSCCIANIEANGNCGNHCDGSSFGAEDCVEMMGWEQGGTWNDVPCAGRPGNGHMCGFVAGGECLPNRYVFYPQRLTQQKAEAYCQSQGGHLASVHSDADQAAIVTVAETHRALPPTMRYLFEGNLFNALGTNHGESHFTPETPVYTAVRDPPASLHGQALVFDGDDFVTVDSPFPHEASDFAITVWLAPSEIVFNGWHAIIGYQNGGVCPGRSPSMWVDGGGHGENAAGVNKGLHYDSCEEETATRFAGVIPDFFQNDDEWVMIAWVKVSDPAPKYLFYRNGQPLNQDGSVATGGVGEAFQAPNEVQLSDKYNIGHNDNYFVGAISEVAFYDFAISASDVASMYSGEETHMSIGDAATEVWIGYSDRDSEAFCNGESGFIWTDATATHYNAWSDGEPNDWLCTSNGEVHNGANQNGDGQVCGSDCEGAGNGDMVTDETTQHEDCVAILKGRDWGWNDYHCDLHLQFVCGFCTPACAPTSYQYYGNPLSWGDAEDFCVDQGGHLASMHSVDDVRTVQAIVRGVQTTPLQYWIGMHDLDELGAVEGGCSGETFQWTDDTMNDFSNFSPGEPNDWSNGQAHCTSGCDNYWSPSGGGCQDDAVGVAAGAGGEDCVLMDPTRTAGGADDLGETSRYGPHPIAGREGTNQWNDGVCATEAPFVCGFCTPAGGASKPQSYVYMADEQPFATAQFNCLRLGGNLASIHSPEDQAAVLALLPHGTPKDTTAGETLIPGHDISCIDTGVGWTGQCTAWIGFHDRDGEGGCEGQLFFWSDGTETDYMNWAQGEPNDWNAVDQTTCGGGANGEDCVIMFETCPEGQCAGQDGSSQEGEAGFWNDALCDVAHPYICGFA